MNIGLIGCGRVSEIHMNVYKNIPEAEVVAVSDIKVERAKAFAQKYGIRKAYGDYSKLLEMKDLDFVDICTPISTHGKIACETARAGLNVFLEKPLARSSLECDEIIREVKKQRVKLCICHNQLFIPQVMEAKALVDSGEFNLAYFRVSVRESAELIGAPSWIMTPEQGGALWETGTHAAYLQLHFLKDIDSVSAVGEKIQHPVHDHFIALLSSRNKSVGVIEISWLAKKEEILFDLKDSKGKQLQILDYNFLVKPPSRRPESILRGFYWDQKLVTSKWIKFLRNNLRNRSILNCLPQYILMCKYMDCLKNDVEPPITPEEGRRTVKLLECIQESLDKNQAVKMENHAP